MKSFLTLLSIVFAVTTASAFAGGISGGGGGTTTPRPVHPSAVRDALSDFAGISLLAWAKGAEFHFLSQPAEKRAAHPYAKLFLGKTTIYDVLSSAKVELKTSAPCRDAYGEARDGSVHSEIPGAVCLSAFTMAPKLGDTNVREETLALLLHELSHQLGTTEEEATLIQERALVDLDRLNLNDALTNANYASGWLKGLIEYVDVFVGSSRPFRTKHLYEIGTTFENVFQGISFSGSASFNLLRPHSFYRLLAHDVGNQAMGEYLCASDEQEADEIRKNCNERLDRGFAGEEMTNAGTYLARQGNMPGSLTEEFYAEEFRRVRSDADARAKLAETSRFWKEIGTELNSHAGAKVEVVQN